MGGFGGKEGGGLGEGRRRGEGEGRGERGEEEREGGGKTHFVTMSWMLALSRRYWRGVYGGFRCMFCDKVVYLNPWYEEVLLGLIGQRYEAVVLRFISNDLGNIQPVLGNMEAVRPNPLGSFAPSCPRSGTKLLRSQNTR